MEQTTFDNNASPDATSPWEPTNRKARRKASAIDRKYRKRLSPKEREELNVMT